MISFDPYKVALVDDAAEEAELRDIYTKLAGALGEDVETILARARERAEELDVQPEPAPLMCRCGRDIVVTVDVTRPARCGYCLADEAAEEDRLAGPPWKKGEV